MDSKKETTKVWGQAVAVGFGWLSLLAAALKCFATFAVPHLEEHQSNPKCSLLIAVLRLPKELPWVGAVILTGCGAFLIKLPTWKRWVHTLGAEIQVIR